MAATEPQIRKDNIPLAVTVIVLTVLALSLGDALIKQTSNNFVIWQIFVVRSVIAIPCLIVFMRFAISESFRIPFRIYGAPGWTTLRSLLLVAMWVSYYVSLPQLSLSVAAAAYYTLPLFITLFSALFTGDRITRYGWIAVVTGFFGVLLILKPMPGDFNLYALCPLLSAILYAMAMILTRTRCKSEHPLLLSLALNIAFIFIGGIATLYTLTLPDELQQGFALAPWSSMGKTEWITMGLLAAALLIGSIGAAIAYQNAPPSVVGVFDFAYVGFAVLWGFLFFTEVPDFISLFGIAMIVTAGIISQRQ